MLVSNRVAGLAAPPRARGAAAVSPRWASPEMPRPAVLLADTHGVQPAAEGWPKAISALLLGTAALGLASTALLARAAAPRMDLELGDMDAEAPSHPRGRHGGGASFQAHHCRDRRGVASILFVCAQLH